MDNVYVAAGEVLELLGCQSGATTGNKFRPLVLTEVHKESRNLLKVNETLCTNNLTTSSLISHWVPTLMMGSFSRSSRRSVSAILPLWNFSWNVPCEFIYHAANAPNAAADSSSATTSTTIADNRPNDVVSFFSFQWNIFSKFIDDRLISSGHWHPKALSILQQHFLAVIL